ncbi:hypothetical protein H2200_012089 [Cladophialophora chaetospira]|uniref:Uncharacterized protein n=1 Tax=Cladophialophora chaetospira TaxID=386627 RepID=A0AA38WY48_9EURO|nr:hypothetical protein H2200_012089 [Cladophialophora chaetospira]
MAASSGDVEMLDATVRDFEQLPTNFQYQAALESVGLDGRSRIKSGVDIGSTFSSINYGIVHQGASVAEPGNGPQTVQVDKNPQIPTVAAFFRDEKTSTCKLVFGTRAIRPPPTGHKVLARIALFKFSIVSQDAEFPQDQKLLSLIFKLQQQQSAQIEEVRSALFNCRYLVHDPLTRQQYPKTLNSINCINREFVRFLWHSAQADFASKHGLDPSLVAKFFKTKADVAVAVPAVSVWDDETKDILRELLNDAGFPKTTCIGFEANAAALYGLAIAAERGGVPITDMANDEETRVNTDIGGLTVDICGLVVVVDETGTDVKVKEKIPGTSSFHGSQFINELLKEYLKETFPDGLSNHMVGFIGTEDDVLNAFDKAFELIKQTFDGALAQYVIRPRFDSASHSQWHFRGLSPTELVLENDYMILSNSVMKEIFDKVLVLIGKSIKDCILEVDGPCKITLTGGGSRPPYVLEFLRRQLERTGPSVPAKQRITVEVAGATTDSAVARDNFLMLHSLDFSTIQQARATFGIQEHKPLVKRNADLSGTTTHKVTGHFRILHSEPVFPLLVDLPMQSWGRDAQVNSSGSFLVEIPNQEIGGWPIEMEKNPPGHVAARYCGDIPYQVDLNLDSLMPYATATILDAGGKPLRDLTSSLLLKSLYKHVASAESFDEEVEEEEDEPSDDMDWTMMDSGATNPPDPPQKYHGGHDVWHADGEFWKI